MVMKAAPSAALEMAQPNLLLELLIIALDAPAQFGDVDQAIEGDGVWERVAGGEEPYRRRRRIVGMWKGPVWDPFVFSDR
jgi:hypothetical protein